MKHESPLLRGNLLASLPETGTDEAFEDLVRSPSARIERIVSRGHATPPGQWYDQDQDEWVLLVEGEAMLEFAEPTENQRLVRGDWVLIPARRKLRVVSTSNPAVWLAVWM
jgi:cupin 2 domain-containing protein